MKFAHLSTLNRAPAYTFGGGRPRTAPDPKHLQGPSVNDTGLGEFDNVGASQVLSTRSRAPRATFGSARRDPIAGATHTVGPGSYGAEGGVGKQTSSRRANAPAYSMGSSRRASLGSGRAQSPGAGKYNPNTSSMSSYRRAPAFSMGSGRRPDLAGKPPSTVGPSASYDDFLSTTRRGPGYSMGSRPSSRERARSPGPGKYSQPSTIGGGTSVSTVRRAPGYSMGMKNHSAAEGGRRRRASIPGPGAYDPVRYLGSTGSNVARGTPAYSFGGGSARSESRERARSPGPGAYRPRSSSFGKQAASGKASSAAYVFSSARRPTIQRGSSGPGPGKYSTGEGEGIGRSGRKSSIGIVTKFGSLAESISAAQSPGPAYNPDDRPLSRNKRGSRAVMGTAPRSSSRKKSEVPGPGQYAVAFSPIQTSAPAYSMGLKTGSFVPIDKDMMGATSHPPEVSGFGHQKDSRRKSAPRALFSSAKRFVYPKGDTPGPGQYGGGV